jgi:ATP-dependent Clp protease ATP-binding subunit ClpB
MKEAVIEELRRQFRPEFLNRIDETIVFHSLTEEHLMKIVDIQLEGLRKRLAERQITLEVADGARRHLVRSGSDPHYGARPLKRAIQREVETPLARLLLQGSVRGHQNVRADYDSATGALVFAQEPAPAGR